ncbi:uncharacterized protein PV09_06720 [Verruconis gallopava]|uniref:CENP-V/GFA domain-containing protein n=1 Tax=Verruconis gallopava TaxID=253628 RepID=A0A0D1XHY6_9PEZI|nr:uncharacterized protein PV09_06720 [Verruconis gallopava]KIW01871.1 hypothetical protein PV09_06720 [Verruconis gallopava]
MAAPADMKTYTGRCHCNATLFTVTIPPLETGASTVTRCNCSICTKSGYSLVYPLREHVTFLRGEGELRAYVFGKKVRTHRFCGVCGTSVLIDFKDVPNPDISKRMAVSINTFDNIEDLIADGKITWKTGDGKHLMDPPYAPLHPSASA